MSSFIAVVVVALLLMGGLVVDGGAQAAAHRRTTQAAAEAARAAVDAGTTQQAAGVGLDVGAMQAAGQAVLARRSLSGVVVVSGGRVRVTTSTTTPTIFLSLIGIRTLTASGEADAELHTP